MSQEMKIEWFTPQHKKSVARRVPVDRLRISVNGTREYQRTIRVVFGSDAVEKFGLARDKFVTWGYTDERQLCLLVTDKTVPLVTRRVFADPKNGQLIIGLPAHDLGITETMTAKDFAFDIVANEGRTFLVVRELRVAPQWGRLALDGAVAG